MPKFDCVVIGAGVAGMTSAIYLKRYHLNILLLEKNAPGGQIIQTPKVENYPGFLSIDGASLAFNMFEQINQLGVSYRFGNVIRIENQNDEKIIYTETETIHTKTIVLALGRVPKKLGLELENELIGKGISFCATCDGMFYKEKSVAIVGGGNSALEEALFLSTICSKVDIFYRGSHLRADEKIQLQISKVPNIKIHYFSEIKQLMKENDRLASIIVQEKEEQKKFDVSGLFIYIGFEPDIAWVENLGLCIDHNYIVVNEKMETNIEGIYACGDIIKKDLYQLTTAIGEGSIAAYQVKNYILENKKE